MKQLNNSGGFIRLFLTVAILALVFYSGIRFGMPYYRYSAFKSDVKAIARLELSDAERIKAQIFERAKELKVPVEEKGINVTIIEKRVKVKARWSEDVDILGVYKRTLEFNIDVIE